LRGIPSFSKKIIIPFKKDKVVEAKNIIAGQANAPSKGIIPALETSSKKR